MMKKSLVALFALTLVAATAFAQSEVHHANPPGLQFQPKNAAGGGGAGGNLVYHNGGRVIANAHVILIFWGSSFADTTKADYTYATTLQQFRNQFGTTPEYNVITQYSGIDDARGVSLPIQQNTLGSGLGIPSTTNAGDDWFDGSTPPTNVTDAFVQSEVKSYISTHGGVASTDYSAIYEVFIPASSYSSSGTSDSCGGPNLAYCAYHSHYVDSANRNVKYSIEPYPSCSGCTVSGWTAAQNQEHFVCHETREAVTDALGNAWYDRRGYEADDKCAWSPTPFFGTNGFGYQYEWSNANSSCVKSR